ncbi:hypothetical protein AKO1_007998 [Acrasis kona]|uniref:Uncharacterized protein n=1 Tax=Acrasis kona TaxID=1008807 RepID=A0AAW2YQI4_9EUKA
MSYDEEIGTYDYFEYTPLDASDYARRFRSPNNSQTDLWKKSMDIWNLESKYLKSGVSPLSERRSLLYDYVKWKQGGIVIGLIGGYIAKMLVYPFEPTYRSPFMKIFASNVVAFRRHNFQHPWGRFFSNVAALGAFYATMWTYRSHRDTKHLERFSTYTTPYGRNLRRVMKEVYPGEYKYTHEDDERLMDYDRKSYVKERDDYRKQMKDEQGYA